MSRQAIKRYLDQIEPTVVRIQPSHDDCVAYTPDVFVELTADRGPPQARRAGGPRIHGLSEEPVPPKLEALVRARLWYDPDRAPELLQRFTLRNVEVVLRILKAHYRRGSEAAEAALVAAGALPVHARAAAAAMRPPLEAELEARVAAALAEAGVPAATPPSPASMARLVRRLRGLEWPTASAALDILWTLELTELVEHQPRLLVVGDPGSGKTTLLEHLLVLTAQRAHPSPSLVSRLRGSRNPLPFLARLAEVAWPDHGRASVDEDARILFEHATRLIRQGGRSEVERVLSRQPVILLLDGLDEVPAPERRRAARAVAAVCRARPTVRCVVTSRPLLDEEAVVFDALCQEGFLRTFVRPLSDPQIDELVSRYFAVARAPGLGRDLLHAFEKDGDLRELAETPVLLAMLCRLRLRSKDRALPVARAELYQECLRDLCEHEIRDGLVEVLSSLGAAFDRAALQREILEPVAHRLHGAGGLAESLPRRQYDALVREGLGRMVDGQVPMGDAERAAEKLLARGGLLLQRGDLVRFTHRTFREYLLATWLARDADRVGAIFNHPDWRVALRLFPAVEAAAAGDWKTVEQRLDAVEKSVSDPKTTGLGALAQGLLDLRRYPGGPDALARCASKVLALLRTWVEQAEPFGELEARRAAGEVLGYAGDPRLDIEPWVRVEPGRAWCGAFEGDEEADADEKPGRIVELAYPYWVRRWPVTVGEYRRFVDAGGYTRPELWNDGWAERELGAWTGPRDWEAQRNRAPNVPVVGVSWWEARAFAQWVQQTPEAPCRPPEPDLLVRLPREVEWERAARGDESAEKPEARSRFPWGPQWSAQHANAEQRFGGPTPVGLFVAGHSARGLWDLAGNVWEWCEDWYAQRAYDRSGPPWILDADDGVPELETFDARGKAVRSRCRVLRGGGWSHDARGCRVSYRGGDGPSDRDGSNGFRLVCCRLPPGP